ncbi:MAG: hypothetical protein AAGF45_10025 [Pseudomonadota bacterium]
MKRYVMIGAPITSVRTPPLLEAALEGHGVRAKVDVEHVDAEDLPAFVASIIDDPGISGLMVTMPHKRAIVPMLHALSEEAAATQTVNAVKRVEGRLVGAQFDGVGLREALLAAGVDLAAARVWLAGLGGAGSAIANTLHAAGCGALILSDTDRERALMVAGILGLPARIADPAEPIHADVLVNATPLGMMAHDPSPFDARTVAQASVVADIVADPNDTQLARLAVASAKTLVTGRDVVRAQVPPIAHWLLADCAAQETRITEKPIPEPSRAPTVP